MNKFDILYEDNHIIVVLKKPNVLCQGDITGDKDLLSMIKEYIKDKYNKPGNVYVGLIHRLDRPVGGIMVYAKTSKSASRLSKMIQEHIFFKEYLLVCYGNLCNSGEFKDKILKVDKKAVISSEGKDSLLKYEVIDKKGDLNLVKVHLITGRFHQIRLQFSSRGCPLYGDQLYGMQDKKQIALFAYHLRFKHPVKDEIMDFMLYPNGGVWDLFNYKEED